MTVLHASHVASFLGAELRGEDIALSGTCSFEHVRPACMLFVERSVVEVWDRLRDLPDNLIICSAADDAYVVSGPHLRVPNPRLSFVRAARHFFPAPSVATMHPSAHIDPGATIGARVAIGAFALIGPDVVIGDDSRIGARVVVAGRTRIGARCQFKPGSVIGEDGFGFVPDEEGRLIHTPHYGGVTIGDDVWIGSLCTVERGIFDDTVIEDDVKIDDLSQISHNSRIGRATCIAAGTIVCGGARVGERSWIGPNSNIIERAHVGEGAFIGIGSNVLGEVPAAAVFAGNPARMLRRNS